MVKITIRNEQDEIVGRIPGRFEACCVQSDGEILALGTDDIFYSFGHVDTSNKTVVLSNGQCYYNATLSIEVPTQRTNLPNADILASRCGDGTV